MIHPAFVSKLISDIFEPPQLFLHFIRVDAPAVCLRDQMMIEKACQIPNQRVSL